MKRSPRIVIEIPLEERARLFVDAETFEDECRLALWLAASRVLDALPELVDRLLDDLDADRRDAA